MHLRLVLPEQDCQHNADIRLQIHWTLDNTQGTARPLALRYLIMMMIILQAFSVVIIDLRLIGINGLLYCYGNIFIFANETDAAVVLYAVCCISVF